MNDASSLLKAVLVTGEYPSSMNTKVTQKPTDDSRFASLPTELVSLILSHLSEHQLTLYECTLVSKQFYSLCIPLLWHVLNFYTIDPAHFLASPHPATHAHYIDQLYLAGTEWTDAHLLRLAPHLSSLRVLSISDDTHITDTSFQHVPHHQLISLQLHSTSLTASSFALLAHASQLSELQWCLSAAQDPAWLTHLSACPLESLELACEQSINDTLLLPFAGLTHLELRLTSPVRLAHPRLTVLSLEPCTMDDASLIALMTLHPALQHLFLHHATRLTDTSLTAMSSLRSLTITHNPNMTSNAIRHLIQHSTLTSIDLYFCNHILASHFSVEDGILGVHLDQHAIQAIRQGKGQMI